MAWWNEIPGFGRSEAEIAELEHAARRNRALYANLPEGTVGPDVAKSAATGLRSGVESAFGAGGDISAMQQGLVARAAEKLGIDPAMAATAAKWTSPLSLLPSSEDIGGLTDKLFGRDEITRHEPVTPIGELTSGATNVASSLIGGPEDALLKLGGLKLGALAIPAAAKVAGKEGREALTEVAKIAPKVDATVGDIANAPAMFEGVSPHEFTGTEQWHRFGQEHGVENLGSPSEADWNASLVPFTTSKGQEFTVPGGVESKSPFTYYDLLHLKQQGINPNDIPPELHQGIHDRMVATMSPPGEVTPERMMNQLVLAQISPNQPLTANELAVARTMVKGPEDLQRLAEMVPWRYSDDPSSITKAQRDTASGEIANKLGLGAGKLGGLGARGTADYTRIAETAQRLQEDPEFFRFRKEAEGGATSAENWANFVERLSNQTPGLSSKTGSFGAVWQNPAEANISAVDRHMAGKFDERMFPSVDDFEKFKATALQRYAKANPEAAPIADYESLPQGFKNDQIFGYLNNNPGMVYRGKPPPGSNSGEGPVNPRVPEHLQPDQAGWIHEPTRIELMSEPYRRVLEANAEEANKAGQSIFASQWMLWDRIRNRLEPHEIMFPGLEKLPRMSMDQMQQARADLSKAGYMSGTKTVDPLTGQPTGLQPVRPLPSASRSSYFDLASGLLGGGALLEVMRQRNQENQQRRGGGT